jgi:hypothetical protein
MKFSFGGPAATKVRSVPKTPTDCVVLIFTSTSVQTIVRDKPFGSSLPKNIAIRPFPLRLIRRA